MGISGQHMKQRDLGMSGRWRILIVFMRVDVASRLIMLLKETINFSYMRTKLTSPRPSITETRPQFREYKNIRDMKQALRYLRSQ